MYKIIHIQERLLYWGIFETKDTRNTHTTTTCQDSQTDGNQRESTITQFASKKFAFCMRLPEYVSQSVPYSPWTFAGVHFKGPVSVYTLIKAIVETRRRGCKLSPSDLDWLVHASRIPVVFDKEIVHACFVPTEAVLGTLSGLKLRFAPEGKVAASPLFVCLAFVFPISTHCIAFDLHLLYFVFDGPLLLPEFPDVEDHRLVQALPFLCLHFEGYRHDWNNGPHGDKHEDKE